MSLDPDCPYHVRGHQDERCTCEPSATHPAYLIAVNSGTAVVAKLTTMRAEEIIREWERFDYAPSIIADYLRDWIAVRAELLRLCGPVCYHDQRRAIEHTFLLMKFGEDDHPSWPEGETWARERAL